MWMVAANFRGGLTAQVDWLGLRAGMLTGPAGHEAKAEARKNEAEDEAEAQKFFRGRGQTH